MMNITKKKVPWPILLAVAILALTISPALAGGDNHRRRWRGNRFALVGEVTDVDTENGTIQVLVSMGSRAMRDHLDLEVTLVTGRPISVLQRKSPPSYHIVQIGLILERPKLYQRIDARVDWMMAAGLLKETRRLAERYGWRVPAMSGLGYAQLGAHFLTVHGTDSKTL